MVGTLSDEYCRLYPEASTRAIAVMLADKFPEVFTSVETARSAVRRKRGSMGVINRESASDKTNYSELAWRKLAEKIPKSDDESIKPHKITGVKRLGIISDLQIPFHDVNVLAIALKYLVDLKCDGILINGDFLDAYQLSRFLKDPRKRSFPQELDDGNEILDLIDNLFPKAKKFFKIGNHDVRLENYMITRAPELLGLRDFTLGNFLQLRRRNYLEIHSAQLMWFGDLGIFHGHEMKGGGGVYPAAAVFRKLGSKCLIGHHHRTDSFQKKTITGHYVQTYVTGCLCGLTPQWLPVNDWNHGFGYVDLIDGVAEVHNMRIDNEVVRQG